jgi:hypothetical protein
MASDRDYIASSAETSLPFDILVETDVVRPVWVEQLGGVYAHLPKATVSRLAGCRDPQSQPLPAESCGPPVLGAIDPRHHWKLRERRAMRDLARACLMAVLARETSGVSEPLEPLMRSGEAAQVAPITQASTGAQRLVVVAALHWAQAAGEELSEPLPTEVSLSDFACEADSSAGVVMTVSPIGTRQALSELYVRLEGVAQGSDLVIVDHLGAEHVAVFDAASGAYEARFEVPQEGPPDQVVLELAWRAPT